MMKWPFIIGSVALLILAAVYLFCPQLGLWLCPWLDPRGCREDIYRFGLLFGGGVGLLFACWRIQIADKQAAAAQSQSETAEKNFLNEQFKSGVELLGHDRMPCRLGGISTLVEMAELHRETAYQRVLKLFEAFLSYPPGFASDQGNHKKKEVDYGSQDTVEIIRIINCGRLKTEDGISLPQGGAFIVKEGYVKANPEHSDYKNGRG